MSQTNTSTDAIKALTDSHATITPTLAEELLTAAIEIKARAYCPYSKFRVGAAVLVTATKDNNDVPRLFTGVNVENAAYPVGTCAERCAIGTAVAAGYPHIVALAVSTDIYPPASPCGMCRQFIRECVNDGRVLVVMMGSKDGEDSNAAMEGAVIRRFEELLPMSFGPEDLPGVDTTGTK